MRWTAVECLGDDPTKMKFSEKTDVWAFGITVVEIFTDARRPYKDINKNWEVIEKVTSGYRMSVPPDCPEDLFNSIILPCWDENPDNRPTFADIESYLKLKLGGADRTTLQRHTSGASVGTTGSGGSSNGSATPMLQETSFNSTSALPTIPEYVNDGVKEVVANEYLNEEVDGSHSPIRAWPNAMSENMLVAESAGIYGAKVKSSVAGTDFDEPAFMHEHATAASASSASAAIAAAAAAAEGQLEEDDEEYSHLASKPAQPTPDNRRNSMVHQMVSAFERYASLQNGATLDGSVALDGDFSNMGESDADAIRTKTLITDTGSYFQVREGDASSDDASHYGTSPARPPPRGVRAESTLHPLAESASDANAEEEAAPAIPIKHRVVEEEYEEPPRRGDDDDIVFAGDNSGGGDDDEPLPPLPAKAGGSQPPPLPPPDDDDDDADAPLPPPPPLPQGDNDDVYGSRVGPSANGVIANDDNDEEEGGGEAFDADMPLPPLPPKSSGLGVAAEESDIQAQNDYQNHHPRRRSPQYNEYAEPDEQDKNNNNNNNNNNDNGNDDVEYGDGNPEEYMPYKPEPGGRDANSINRHNVVNPLFQDGNQQAEPSPPTLKKSSFGSFGSTRNMFLPPPLPADDTETAYNTLMRENSTVSPDNEYNATGEEYSSAPQVDNEYTSPNEYEEP